MDTEIYKSLFKNSLSIMLIIHPETGNIIDANKAACSFYGYKEQELIDMKIQDINMLSEQQVLQEMQRAKFENRNYFNFIHRLADGQFRDVEVFSCPIVIHDEKVLYSIIHDITKRKYIEKKIIIEKQFSESLINSLPGVMYAFDQLGYFRRWNKNFETVTGYSSDQINHMNPLDFIASVDKNRVQKMIKKVFNEGNADIEARFHTISGNIIPYLLTGYRLEQNDMKYLVGVGIDISYKIKTAKEKENLIIQLQDTLSQAKQLSGLLPICASCKKIRDDKGYWKQIELYIMEHSEADFSHSICPDCAKKLYPDLIDDNF